MCIIIDANRLGDLLAEPTNPEVAPVRRWLKKGGRLIYSTGGDFAAEVGRRARARLLEYARDGSALQVPWAKIEADALALAPQIRSDDPHVLALARFSGARLLYTHDGHLIEDFKNKTIIDGPRGKVYPLRAY